MFPFLAVPSPKMEVLLPFWATHKKTKALSKICRVDLCISSTKVYIPLPFYLVPNFNFLIGHSRTIIGVEKHKTGKYYMLVLDPSVSEGAMAHALKEQNLTALKILRLPQEYLLVRLFPPSPLPLLSLS